MTELPKTLALNEITAVILAGGQGKRVGFQQKALLPFKGKPLIEWVLQALQHQGTSVAINANQQSVKEYQRFGVKVFADETAEFLGPMAGMTYAFNALPQEWLLFVPCDNPYLPKDLVRYMVEAYQSHPNPILVAFEGEQIQPLYCLMHRSQHADLLSALRQNHLSVKRWIQSRSFTPIPIKTEQENGFFNYNNLENLTQ